ncbi:sugar phosphate isomerase/epimerase family protein [Brevundimonas sp. GN22]
MHLALDHLTVTDAYPWEVAALAGQNGLQGCCLFLESMSVLPLMPTYSLIEDTDALHRTREALETHQVTLDLVYPFTVTSRTQTQDFDKALKTAAALKARAINLLVYDRDSERAARSVSALAEAAGQYGMEAVIEFYPASAIKTLQQAHELVEAAGQGNLGINVDILHLYRSGGAIEDLTRFNTHIRFAQLADGPLLPPENLEVEAAQSRLDPGQGEFDLVGFAQGLPPVPASFESPGQMEAAQSSQRLQTMTEFGRSLGVNS